MSITFLLNALAVSAFFATAGFWWDGWWHVAIGRDSFWNPPHIVEYAYIVLVVLASAMLYRKTKQRVYAGVFVSIIISIAMGFIDVAWHSFVPFEDLRSPLVIWAPAHLTALLAGLFAMGLLMHDLITRHVSSDTLSFFRIILLSGAIMGMINLLVFPFQPFGWYKILGFWGAGVATFAVVVYLFYLAHALPRTGILTLSMIMLLVFLGFKAQKVAGIVIIPPHADVPRWLHFFAVIPSVIWVDFIEVKKYKLPILGGLMGFITYMTYIVFWEFIQSDKFPYTRSDAWVLLIAASLGGICAGFFYQYIGSRFLHTKRNTVKR